MITDKSLFTPTLARVYAGQGHFQEAAQIYRHLQAAWPNRSEYREAFQQIENRLRSKELPSEEDLIGLISTWVDLEMGYARMKRIEALRRNRSVIPEKNG